jgi:hypothetical protein
MPRKYFRASIQELEALFKGQNDSIEVLQELHDELAHRTTDRAGKLRSRITDRLTNLREGGQKETVHVPPDVPPPQPNPRASAHAEQTSRSTQPQPESPSPASETFRTEPPRAQQPPLPPVTNRPEEVLSAWTALEVLSPPSYSRREDLAGGDRTRIVSLDEACASMGTG